MLFATRSISPQHFCAQIMFHVGRNCLKVVNFTNLFTQNAKKARPVVGSMHYVLSEMEIYEYYKTLHEDLNLTQF